MSTAEPHDAPANPLEFLSSGKPQSTNYHVRSAELIKDPRALEMDWDWDYSNGFGGTGAAQISFLQLLLPSKKQVSHLVDYHLRSILWYHASFHGPTFQKELNDAYSGASGYQIRETDLRWSALLFAVMAASMSCASDNQTQVWGFQKAERAKLTRQWFKATLSCLNLADYMWRHHIYSVQAIEVLTMSAHVLGFSNTQSTLLGAALKIAQGLGLQRLSSEEDTPISPDLSPVEKDKVIRRELGRRMWTQLCIQDWFSIPFSEMYTIQRHHFQTVAPEPIDDQTLTLVSIESPTVISFVRGMVDLARLFSQCHDAIMRASTLLTKYDEVQNFEQKIRDLYLQLPDVMSVHKPIDPSWPHWIPWARRSLAVCYAHKQIMVHRHFLGRSFTEPTFARTRETCMTAAKTILKEAKTGYEGEGPVLWIDQAFIVAAGITLSLDLFHLSPSDSHFDEHRKHVEIAISTLGKFENSMIAIRGIRLLSSLLTEQARLTANQSLDNYNRAKRARDTESVGSSGNAHMYSDPNHNKRHRQKFDVPRFVESLGHDDSFTQRLQNTGRARESGMASIFENPMQHVQNQHNNPQMVPPSQHYGSIQYNSTLSASNAQQGAPTSYGYAGNGNAQRLQDQLHQYQNLDLGFETFEQLFPPQTGISNSFLFEDLLNFDL